MSTELIINASLPETRIALMENGEIQDLLIERATGKGIVGNIYKGRVTRVLPGMQAAFVDIGLEKAAFLYVDDVFVHSEIWEAEESESADVAEATAASEKKAENVRAGESADGGASDSVSGNEPAPTASQAEAGAVAGLAAGVAASEAGGSGPEVGDDEAAEWAGEVGGEAEGGAGEDQDLDDLATAVDDEDSDEDEDEDDEGPVGMCPPPGDEGQGGGDPDGTVRPEPRSSGGNEGAQDSGQGGGEGQAAGAEGGEGQGGGRRRRHRRGRRGGRFRKRNREEGDQGQGQQQGQRAAGGEGEGQVSGELPESYHEHVEDHGEASSDRLAMSNAQVQDEPRAEGDAGQAGRPEAGASGGLAARQGGAEKAGKRPEFKEQRGKDRRIKPKQAAKPVRGQANIQDLLKEGQEVIVQVAKDPIATKGARLTCHISLPGRHLVCMPTIDHVGVSRRIERDDERRKLREYVERSRPKGLGFIVRTASGRGQSEKRIKQDVDYLSRLWNEIREKAAEVTAPALVYEDLNSVLRAIRDWVTEDIDKIVVDSRYHYNEIQRFVSHFMPSLKQKVELYHGDVPIFDAYNISTELARALERKVWLKSGGYIVIDQAEALVAIDVNTGRFVGKKNLEDTILKTNLEAVQEIAYQLRLRNCGGIIILDLIDMEKEENKQRVYRALEEALKKDRARPTILKISELGLVEMTRKRTRDTMVRALCDSCSHCEGKGFVKSKLTVAYEVLRELERVGIERDTGKVLVQAHPEVIDILAIDERDTLDQLERRYRKPVYLQAVMDYHMERFELIGDKLEKGERAQLITGDRERDRGDRDRGGRDRDRGGRDRDRGDRDRGRRGGRDRERGGNEQRGGGRDRGRDRPAHPVPNAPAAVDPLAYVGSPEPSGPAGHEGVHASQAEGGVSQATAASPRREEDFNEEDRLAFLRAQAAQDAALARLGGSAAPGASADGQQRRGQGRGPGQNPQGQSQAEEGGEGGRGGRRGRRGRRGGKQRRGRGEGRGPLGVQVAPRGQGGEDGGAPSGGEGYSGGGGSGSEGGGGGGGDTGGSSGPSDHPQS